MQTTPSVDFSQFINAIETHNKLFPNEPKNLIQTSSMTVFHAKLFGNITTKCEFFEDKKNGNLHLVKGSSLTFHIKN